MSRWINKIRNSECDLSDLEYVQKKRGTHAIHACSFAVFRLSQTRRSPQRWKALTPQRLSDIAMGFSKAVAKEAPESYKQYYLPFGLAWFRKPLALQI